MVMTHAPKRGTKKMAKLRSRLEILIAQYNIDNRDKPKLTQKRLAEECRLSENTITRLARNDFSQIEADTIEKLFDFFEIEDDDLNELLVLVRE